MTSGEGNGASRDHDHTASVKLEWWWSRDEERFYGPCSSRANAIMDAWADDAEQGAHVCQAGQGEWNTDVFDADWMAERFDEANEDNSDPDGDPASSVLPNAKWKQLADRANAVVRAAIRETGTRAWGFERQTSDEWVDIPAMWALAQADPALSSEAPSAIPSAASASASTPDEQHDL